MALCESKSSQIKWTFHSWNIDLVKSDQYLFFFCSCHVELVHEYVQQKHMWRMGRQWLNNISPYSITSLKKFLWPYCQNTH